MDEQKFTKTLLEMSEKLSQVATKQQVADLGDRMSTQFDQQSVILQRLDQERVFTLERVKQLETEVENIKLQLKIA